MREQDIFAALASADQEVLAIIAEPFFETVDCDRGQLMQASAAQDFQGLEITAHSLKGVVGHFAMPDLENLLREIENNARLQKQNPAQVHEVIVLLEALERALRKYLPA